MTGGHHDRWRRRLIAGALALALVGGPVRPASAVTQNERFVSRIYTDFILAEPTLTELADFAGQLDGGTSRTSVVTQVLNQNSFNDLLAHAIHFQYLGRLATSSELPSASSQIGSGGFVAVETALLASADFYVAAGETDAGYVTDLFELVLQRTPSPGDVTYWSDQVAVHSRSWVATSVIKSVESRNLRVAGPSSETTCVRTAVTHPSDLFAGAYCLILDRMADSAGQSYWVGALQSNGGNLRTIMISLAASTEYYAAS